MSSPPPPNETKLKGEIFNLFLTNGWLARMTNSGSKGKTKFYRWRVMLPPGVEVPAEHLRYIDGSQTAYWPDLEFWHWHTGRHVVVEAKTDSGDLSAGQQAFRWLWQAMGKDHIVARSTDDCLAYMTSVGLRPRLLID